MSFQAGTATLVPCVTNANLATSLFAPAGSGGGGGGGGAELEISTILFGPGQFGLGVLDVTNPTTLAINNNTTAAVNDIVFTTNNTNFETPANFIEINSPDATNLIQFIAQNNGNNGVVSQQGSLTLGAESTISVVASSISLFAPTSISSLTVSSINGAAPGGGGSVGPDLTVSTLTVNDVGSIQFPYNNGGGSINFNFDNTNTSSFTIQQVANQFASRVHTANGAIAVLEQDGALLNAYAPLQASGFEINTQGFPGVPTAGLYTSTGGVYLYANGGLIIDSAASVSSLQVSTINAGSLDTLAIGGNLTVFNQIACSGLSTNQIEPVSGTDVTISALLVSSINNAAYPPASSAYPKVSTIGLGGGGSQTSYDSISTNSFAQFTTPFDVVQNHCYEVSWNYNLKPSSAAQFTDYATFATTGLNAGTQAVVVPLAVSSLTQSRIFFIGQNTGQTYLACSTETSFPVELDLNYSTENVNLIDFGPIATSF